MGSTALVAAVRALGGIAHGRGRPKDGSQTPASPCPGGGGRGAMEPGGTASTVFMTRGATAEENMRRLLASMGGVESFVSRDDIVLLKPNAQWWNQGMSNTDALGALIEAILRVDRFSGEILVCENHHYLPDDSRGWTTDRPNGKRNLNQLVEYFRKEGHACVDKVVWRDAGANPSPREGDAGWGRRVGDGEGESGYVWDKSCIYRSPEGRLCMMTYPVFASPVSGIRVNVRTGAAEGRSGRRRRVCFINFSGINHHGPYAGVTGSIKNLMGVVDMTCGYPGPEPKGYWSTHFIGSESPLRQFGLFSRRVLERLAGEGGDLYRRLSRLGEFHFRYTGGALGYWIAHVRRPTTNFICAEWVGWGSRTDPAKSARPRALLASVDPVALDYTAAKEILLPATIASTDRADLIRLNDPDQDPFRGFLAECRNECGGNIDPSLIEVRHV